MRDILGADMDTWRVGCVPIGVHHDSQSAEKGIMSKVISSEPA